MQTERTKAQGGCAKLQGGAAGLPEAEREEAVKRDLSECWLRLAALADAFQEHAAHEDDGTPEAGALHHFSFAIRDCADRLQAVLSTHKLAM